KKRKIIGNTFIDVFEEQATALITGGADVLLLETQHDILEVKAAILGCRRAIDFSKKPIILQAQVTVDQHGKMLYGTDILTACNIIRDLGIDVFGINCSTGPAEMEASLRKLAEYSPLPISVLPNAGMPVNKNGKASYPLTPKEFAAVLTRFIRDYGLQVVGGCCGTRPEHISALAMAVAQETGTRKIARSQTKSLPLFASPIGNLKKEFSPILIGERLNAQGSKKAKQLMLTEDYSSLMELARNQEAQGADLLDLCFAMTERSDEAAQLSHFTNKVAYATTCPLCFDSTEPEVLAGALKRYAGRPLINSINLESDKLHQVLPLLKAFGVTTIALCIDEKGMAKTSAEKVAIAKSLYKIAVKDYRLHPSQLMIDPLTFTLATGEAEYLTSAQETFEALSRIKKECPGVSTVLGVSNISFGLKPESRRLLNLVYLHLAVGYGLDYAIFHVADYKPLEEISLEERTLAENLIFNRNPSALLDLVNYFQQRESTSPVISTPTEKQDIAALLQEKILERKQEGLIALLEKARKTILPEDIVSRILLPAMRKVGEKMDSGELILPFVLESAEVMKLALHHLEKYMDKSTNITKGTVVLATVFGDVHDIGKNLVKTILANNGYRVIDLGKQVPVEEIVTSAIREKADAIALSALLVTTSKQMKLVVEMLRDKNLRIPVIIGGAAINEPFARAISELDGKAYEGKVYYAKDAFGGLKIMQQLTHG
ncbi:MAG: homocysteine S-methyltransferase family protein, partial [Candidatus Margulisiibacteriota bacterium]